MKRKFILGLIVGVMMVALLISGCSSKSSKTQKDTATPSVTVKAPVEKQYTFKNYKLIKSADSLIGFKNSITGKVVIKPQYHNVMDTYQEKYMRVKIGEVYGIIDAKGKEITDVKYEGIGPFSEGLAYVVVEQTDANGNSGKYYGFINEQGEEIIKPQYKVPWGIKYGKLANFHEGLAALALEKKVDIHPTKEVTMSVDQKYYTYIDKKGAPVFGGKTFKYAGDFSDGLATVLTFEENLYGYIDKKGEIIIKPQFKEAGNFNNGLAAVVASEVTAKKDANGYYINIKGIRDTSKPNPLSVESQKRVDVSPPLFRTNYTEI